MKAEQKYLTGKCCLRSLFKISMDQRCKKSTVLCSIFSGPHKSSVTDRTVWSWSEALKGTLEVCYFDSEFQGYTQRSFWKKSSEIFHRLIPISSYRFQYMVLLSTGSSWCYSKTTQADKAQMGQRWSIWEFGMLRFACWSWKLTRRKKQVGRWEMCSKHFGRCSMTHKQDELNFTEVTKTYPLKFCAHQWLPNVS